MQNQTMPKQAAIATLDEQGKEEHQFQDGESLKIRVI
jgi:hypothetical protein